MIWDGMGLVAKRIEHVPASEPPTIAVRSLNPEHPSYELTGEEVNIVGRAVWAGKRLRFATRFARRNGSAPLRACLGRR